MTDRGEPKEGDRSAASPEQPGHGGVQAVTALLGNDAGREPLLAYLQLPARERSEVREALRLEVLEWLEEAAARVDADSAVAAVLALRSVQSFPADRVLATLSPARKRWQECRWQAVKRSVVGRRRRPGRRAARETLSIRWRPSFGRET